MSPQKSVFELLDQSGLERAPRVEQLRELGFTWADLEEEEYWLDAIAVMSAGTYRELAAASEKLWSILDKAVRYVHHRQDLYELLGIPPVLWQMLDDTPLPEPGLISRYARFDFAVSDEGAIKLLELNADTPTGYVEASIATPWICKQAGIGSPNGAMKELLAAAWGIERPDTAACVAYGSHQEDSGTIEALVRHSGLDIKCVDCLDLWIDQGRVYDGQNRRIERMFALYPKEWMAVDEAGDALAYAVETGSLQLFNGPHSILLQSKGLIAAVWGMYELGLLYNEEEREAISRYILPTYNKPVFSGSFVSKSVFGREGGSVRLFDDSGELELEDEEGFDSSVLFPTVYQKRAELARIQAAEGELHLLTGMFVINGKPCGLLGRAGGPITGNASHFIALGVRELEQE
ncbi:glutathionylspermidine synthase [Paenibacillus sp. FSL R7-0273]|uniref:glutathionylspermidine synthase family protein n=1 Tax=Paenibacillus sp. FSL R7-0273 TaxID=1536772 RepID=UPI0004F6D775|nr:glutathionylspermidine synthase family protein [Paenibacillus sp. FSL R7-0273]AIQ49916.1 glutathionylspermidine synthase [Paenibacillus sp. FSL R7-0273]OMF84798.1 glutathionylspermidine synthase [Paenibacillus sp. FSL R7-0273]